MDVVACRNKSSWPPAAELLWLHVLQSEWTVPLEGCPAHAVLAGLACCWCEHMQV